ncbi:hypothetical protein CYLTODRAFT_146436 [Cylindrobasidium torrendii FP15055 ss-10]|uniref:Uncharacterized protein n=1 Tax=Cylindrobasidium torrendii FP15055 ss-10 TaxID=1314674 RepID=A0A0D7AZ82_9AGAR|nr:hypothetical protein CYLTODRAFT_146436 [Cylindrobasidium torrendii FP15055 ss-10]
MSDSDDRVTVEDQIRCITTLLEGRLLGPLADKEIQKRASAFDYLSHLLCLPNESSAVVVTGNIKPSGISLVAFAPSGSSDAQNANLSVVEIQAGPQPECAQDVFRNLPNSAGELNGEFPSLKRHAAVCMSGLALVRDKKLSKGHIHNWYVVCGRQKLRTRVRRISSIWPNVFDVFKSYRGAGVNGELGHIPLVPQNQSVLDFCRKTAPQLVNGEDFVRVVGESTAPGWTKVIAYILEQLEVQTREDFRHPKGKGDANVERMRSVTTLVYTLHVISRSRAVETLFRVDELAKFFAEKRGTMSLETDDPDAIAEVHDLDSKEHGITFLKQLRNICSWYAALDYFGRAQYMDSSPDPTLHLVLVPSPKPCDLGYLKDSIRREVLTTRPGIATDFQKSSELDKQLSNVNSSKCNVHCEAVLVALAARKDSLLKTLLEDTETTQVPIGVNKRCCWTCYQLLNISRSHNSLFGSGEFRIKLEGTHRMVYPWSPPEGLPMEVLRALKASLVTEYAAIIDTEFAQASSHHTSPAGSFDLEEEPVSAFN